MKIVGYIVGSVVAAIALLFALTRLGMPAVLLLAALGGVALLLARKVRTDPYIGWGYFRAFGVMVALALFAWTAMAFLSGSLLLALPLAAAAALSIWWITFCTQKIRSSLGTAPAGKNPNAGLSMASQNLAAANDLTDKIIENGSRSHARGRSLHLQGENLDLMRRNRELEGEVARLRGQVAELDGALHDPFYDPIAKA